MGDAKERRMSVEDWLERMQQTIAVDIGRFASAGLPPSAIVVKLFEIPEVAQAFHLRARGKLDIDIDTPEGQALAAERIEWVADFLDDGFHERTVEDLRKVIGDLTELG
jgi:hypothetical protein